MFLRRLSSSTATELSSSSPSPSGPAVAAESGAGVSGGALPTLLDALRFLGADALAALPTGVGAATASGASDASAGAAAGDAAPRRSELSTAEGGPYRLLNGSSSGSTPRSDVNVSSPRPSE